MKKLQNNFTTPEQSKRLLELGVPEDSADCYYRRSHNHLKDERFPDVIVGPDILIGTYDSFSDAVKDAEGTIYETIPCWSVGRLIEMFIKCSMYHSFSATDLSELTFIEQILHGFEFVIKEKMIDFSKLED